MNFNNITTPNAADEIEHEFFPLFRLYKSGRTQRIIEPPFLPAAFDPATAVVSKDVVIDPQTPVTARLYLPQTLAVAADRRKLPILVYYHGGGFFIETPFSPTYHPYLNSLVAAANVLAVSVHYRRLPDHPLPAAYDDSWSALKWVPSPAADPWIREFGDLTRVFVAGDSAGANIAHQMAVRVGSEGLANGIRIKGAALVHPYFWRREGSERDEGMERVWRLVRPATEGGLEDPMLNPLVGPAGAMRGCGKVAVSLAGMDILSMVGKEYGERLKEEEVEVEMWETEGVNHVFHLLAPETEAAVAEMGRMVAFLNSE